MQKLAKTLGLGAALSMGIGTMICGGIFSLAGIIASFSGPGVILSFVLGGFVALLIALCLAELSTGMPEAGGCYFFVSRAFGPLFASIVGWSLWAGLIFASAFYMVTFGIYVHTFVPLPPIVIALIMTIIFIFINYIGAKESGNVQNLMVAVLLGVLIIFVAVGIFRVNLSYFKPFTPFGFLPIFKGTALSFIAYCGFAEICAVSEEIKNPNKNLPLSLIGSLIIVILLYCLVCFCIVGLKRYNDPGMNNPTVLVQIAKGLMGPFGKVIIIIGGIMATLTSANGSIMAASRVNFAMGRDKLVSNWLNEVHPRFGTPYRAIIITGIVVLGLLFFNKLEFLAEVGSFFNIFVYALVCLTCVIMRQVDVKWYKPGFKVPLFPILPLIGFVACIFVMSRMERVVLWIGGGFILACVMYFVVSSQKKVHIENITNLLIKEKVITPIAKIVSESIEKEKEKVVKILVPISNPEIGIHFANLASSIVKKENGIVTLVNVLEIPSQTALELAAESLEGKRREEKVILNMVVAHAKEKGIKFEENIIFGRDVPSTLLALAESGEYKMVILGWREKKSKIPNDVIITLEKYAKISVLVIRIKEFRELKTILIPYGGGPHAKLGLKIASNIAEAEKSNLIIIRVIPKTKSEISVNEAKKQLEIEIENAGIIAEKKVIISDSITDTVVNESKLSDLIVVGASNEWILRRKLFGSIPDEIAEKAECSVLMVRSAQTGTV